MVIVENRTLILKRVGAKYQCLLLMVSFTIGDENVTKPPHGL